MRINVTVPTSEAVSTKTTSLKALTLYQRPLVILLLVAGMLCCYMQHALADDTPQPRLPTFKMQVNDVEFTAEIAASPQQRYMGLSFRPGLDKNSGMLFVYPAEQKLSFTMRNTLIPLSIAFISSDLVINEIHLMDVGPGQIFNSRKPAQYALEVDQGWFKANGIKPGDQIVRLVQ